MSTMHAKNSRAISGSVTELFPDEGDGFKEESGTFLRSEISDVIDEEPATPTGESVAEVVDFMNYKLRNDSKFDRVAESKALEGLLAERTELGLSIDRYTRMGVEKIKTENGFERVEVERKDFRYRRREWDGDGGQWTGRKHVLVAVEALKQYDSLIDSDDQMNWDKAQIISVLYFTKEAQKKTDDIIQGRMDKIQQDNIRLAKAEYNILVRDDNWQSLQRAKDIALDFFDDGEKKSAMEILDAKLDYKADELADKAMDSMMDPEIVSQVYDQLIRTEEVDLAEKAMHLAEKYMPENVAKARSRYNILSIQDVPEWEFDVTDTVEMAMPPEFIEELDPAYVELTGQEIELEEVIADGDIVEVTDIGVYEGPMELEISCEYVEEPVGQASPPPLPASVPPPLPENLRQTMQLPALAYDRGAGEYGALVQSTRPAMPPPVPRGAKRTSPPPPNFGSVSKQYHALVASGDPMKARQAGDLARDSNMPGPMVDAAYGKADLLMRHEPVGNKRPTPAYLPPPPPCVTGQTLRPLTPAYGVKA